MSKRRKYRWILFLWAGAILCLEIGVIFGVPGNIAHYSPNPKYQIFIIYALTSAPIAGAVALGLVQLATELWSTHRSSLRFGLQALLAVMTLLAIALGVFTQFWRHD